MPKDGRSLIILFKIVDTRKVKMTSVTFRRVIIKDLQTAIERLGGKIKNAWFAFGDHDVILITEMPDNVSAAAIAIAFAGGGACKSVQTTPLLSTEEAMQGMKKANEIEIGRAHV